MDAFQLLLPATECISVEAHVVHSLGFKLLLTSVTCACLLAKYLNIHWMDFNKFLRK